MRLLLTFSLLLLSGCASTQWCADRGGDMDFMLGCISTSTGQFLSRQSPTLKMQEAEAQHLAELKATMSPEGFERYLAARASQPAPSSSMNPIAAMFLLQSMQAPRPPLVPVPVQPLARTCFNTVAGNQIIAQCY